jgi:non-specific serine/threonine protein kinase
MEHWEMVKQVHQGALEREASQRAAFLNDACAGDTALRQDVESLLAYQDAAEPFMEAPALEVAARSVSEDRDTRLVGRTLSHYRLQSLLGGNMGEVYLAHDPRLERAVTLKILPSDLAFDADRLQRFAREAKAASALNHPNVATVYDIGESDALHFIVMEYVEGQTLADKIAERPLGPAEILDIGAQVADALDAAHARGITHRDIKPANLMLTPRGQVKVLDFGVAKMTPREVPRPSGEPSAGTQTAVGSVIGSMPYMSPEQLLGHVVDHRSDLFSLGVALYEMATGRRPFAGATIAETTDQILHAQPEPVVRLNSTIPGELEEIILKCLEKAVERRYQSARELLTDLRNLKRYSDGDVIRVPIAEARRDNLPAQLTSFVGRQREIGEVRRLLAESRLLTLTGAGGCGKTRLALQAAGELLDQFTDGVWTVDLGPLAEPGLVTQTVAATLGVRGGANRSVSEALAWYVRPRHVLLILDNCEHLIAACAELVEPLLRAAPNLRVLATSREGLGIPGETVWRVPSMSLPAPSDPLAADALLQSEAVRLFADRAAAMAPAFTITDANAATVAEVCRRLDGIPLAIELAAARLKVLSVDQLNVRLKDRFRLLTGGNRTAVARQRTLEATMDWSYDLLSEAERTLLCRLSVFPGGWTLEAAEEVCAGSGIEKERMLDLLSHLVEKSLVNVEDDTRGSRRYRCLETVRQYGRERLVRSGDAKRVRDRHLDFFFALVRRAEPELRRAEQASWLNRLQIEYDNLRAALEWCLEAPEHGVTGLDLAAGLFWFWSTRGHFGEARQWLEQALAADAGAPPNVQAKALNALGWTTSWLGDYATASLLLERSLALSREADAQGEVALTLGLQAGLAVISGDSERSASLAAESRRAAAASGELWRQLPALECLAYLASSAGDRNRAFQLAEEALELNRRMGDKRSIGVWLRNLALFRVFAGDYAEAEAPCAEAIRIFHELADPLGAAGCLANLAGAQAGLGRAPRAVRLWGAMEGLHDSVGSPVLNIVKDAIGDRYVQPLRQSLGEEAFDAALADGRAMSLTQAVQYAQADML